MATQETGLPPLVDLHDKDFKAKHFGPTDDSNWLIPGLVLMTAYPGSLSENKGEEKVKKLLGAGLNCWVCLQETNELKSFKPYRPIIEKLQDNEIEFLHLPIVDNSITTDENIMGFIRDQLIPRVKSRAVKMLIHCHGGHGRTGTVAALLLSHLYQLSANSALERVDMVHRCRRTARGNAPEMPSQVSQVKRLAYKH